MSCTCVVGLQWGDEAKGKLVDLLGDRHRFVVRYNGGANAGHTIVWGDRKFKLSLLPAGVLRPSLTSVIGNGVVVYPPRFLEEIEQLTEAGIPVGKNLVLSNHAHVIFPYHLEQELLTEQGIAEGGAIGTTGRGIGPCYQDKVGRICGVRVGDLLHPEFLRERLNFIVPRKNRIVRALTGENPPVMELGTGTGKRKRPLGSLTVEDVLEEYLGYAEKVRPFVADTARLLQKAHKAGESILFEAAQGSLLDIDHGTYPFVTSSNSSPAGIWSGSGFPSRYLDRVIGVVKAYSTRVGRGPFPTELDDGGRLQNPIGARIRDRGGEYGTVTGRPRRVGWFDAVAVRATAALAGADELALMLLDVLSGTDELAVCTAYEIDGERTDEFPGDAHLLARCKPVFERLPGWREEVSSARRLADLPAAARRYVDRIGAVIGLPVKTVSVGPDRDQTIVS